MVYVGSSWVELDYWTSPSWGDYDARLRVMAYSEQNVDTNRSKVYFKLQKRVTGGSAYNNDPLDFKITCDDAEDYGHSATQEWTFGSVSSTSWTDVPRDSDMWWGDVRHNSDGTLTLTANAEGDRILGGSFDTDISITLPTIPRASNPTITPTTLTLNTSNNNLSITTNRKSSSFSHTVTVKCGGWSNERTSVLDNVSFDIPYTVLNQFAENEAQKSARVTTKTYKGQTLIGTAYNDITFKVNSAIEHPNIDSITIHDTNSRSSAVTQSDAIYISNISNLSVEIPFSVDGSYTELASATVTCGNQSVTYPLSGTSQTVTWNFNAITSDHLTVVVKDKRGTTVSQTKTWTLIDYQPVSAVATVGRTSETSSVGTGEVTGKAYGGMFGATQNYLDVSVEFKLHEGGTYGGTQTVPRQQLTQSGYNDYSTDTITFTYNLDYQNQYDILFTVSDLFSTATYEAQLMQGLPVISWDETEVDVWGDLHIHDREDPYKYQNVLAGFDAILEHDGHKNLVTMMTPTKTENGITFTNKGTYYEISGTATSNAFCNATTDVPMEVGKKYILSGLHDEWVDGMQVVIRHVSDTTIVAIAEEDDVEFTCPAPCYAYLVIKTGTAVSNKHWYPMIRDARIASETYVPGSMGMQNLRWSGTWSNSSSITRNYRIFGKGLVFASISVLSDSTNDTGSIGAFVDLRSSSAFVTTLGANANRLTTANTVSIRASATGAYYYDGESANDRIQLYATCSKNGTNRWYINFVTVGCTIQQI